MSKGLLSIQHSAFSISTGRFCFWSLAWLLLVSHNQPDVQMRNKSSLRRIYYLQIYLFFLLKIDVYGLRWKNRKRLIGWAICNIFTCLMFYCYSSKVQPWALHTRVNRDLSGLLCEKYPTLLEELLSLLIKYVHH